jgi:hypothetical protein
MVDFQSISVRLDALRALGVDALLLPAPDASAAWEQRRHAESGCTGQPASPGQQPWHAGGADDSSATAIRANLSGVARFWLTRGVAGLHLATPPGTSPEDTQAMVQALRKLASSVTGQRIIVSDLDLTLQTKTDEAKPARFEGQPASGRRGRIRPHNCRSSPTRRSCQR